MNIYNIEMWAHRVLVVVLFIFYIVLAMGVRQSQEMALKNAEMILEQEKTITVIYEILFESASEITQIRDEVNKLR